MSQTEPIFGCRECGAPNEVPAEALAVGRFRCHSCGAVTEIAPPATAPVHTEPVHAEPAQTAASDVPSAYNTAQAAAEVEAREGWLTCCVALAIGVLGLALVIGLMV